MKTNYENLPQRAKARLGTGYITGKIVYSPDGTQLVVPKSTGIWVYDASTLEVIDFISEYRAFNSSAIRDGSRRELIEIDNAVGFSADGNLFAIRVKVPRFTSLGNRAYILQIWTRETKQWKSISIEGPTRMRHSMGFSPDGNILAGSEDGTVYLWNVHTSELQNTLTVGSEKIKSMVFSPGGSTLAFISAVPGIFDPFDYFIDVWDLRTGRRKFNHLNVDCSVVSPDGQMLAGLNADCLLGFSPDGQMLAGRRRDYYGSTVSLWDANTGSRKFTFTDCDPCNLTTPPDPYIDTSLLARATSLAFSPYGPTLAAFSDDTIQLWNYHTGNCKSTFTGIDRITSLVFSPDGSTLAAGCEDGTVLLWDVDRAGGETTLMDDNRFIIPTIEDNNQTILKEKDIEFQNRAFQIQQFCEERGITTLIHFTRIENLHSILQQGLLGRNFLETRGQQFLWNDSDRADGHKEAVCLSISFPNYQMFYRIRNRKKVEGVSDSQWVVLLLDVKMLWELDCAFCQNNAARKTISRTSLEDRKSPEALKGMFGDFYNIRHQDLQIPDPYLMHPKDAYPTHPQAEVLVFDSIPVQFIKAIHFWDETTLEKCRNSYVESYSQTLSVNQQYFTYRKDYEVWRREKFDDDGIPLSYTAENNVDGIPLQPQETSAQTPVPDHPLVTNFDFEVDPNDSFVDPDDEDDIPF